LASGQTIDQVLEAYPGMGMRLQALKTLSDFLQSTKQNSWETSLPIDVGDDYFLRDPPIADVEQQIRLLQTLNKWRECCINGLDLSDESRLWLIGKSGYHKSSLFTHLAITLKWPIVLLNPEDNFPGDPFKLYPYHSRPLILIENCEPRVTTVPYKRLEDIIDRMAGKHLAQKGSQYTFPQLRSPLVFVGNYAPDTWYRHDPPPGEKKGLDQLRENWRAALRRRFEKCTIFLKTPLNFFVNPQAQGFGVISSTKNYDDEEQEYMNM